MLVNKRQTPCILVSFFIGLVFFTILNISKEHINLDSISKHFSSVTLAKTEPKGSMASKARKAFKKKVYIDDEFEYSKITYANTKLVNSETDKSMLIVSSIGSKDSYGKDKAFEDLMNTIGLIDYEANSISLGFLVGEKEEFGKVETFLDNYFNNLAKTDANNKKSLAQYVNKVTLLTAPFIDKAFQSIDRNDRHNDNLQRLRRRSIARSRNFLLLHSLQNEKYTLFIDSDIVKIHHPHMIKTFIASGKDIIVPRIIRGDLQDYDKNSWVGERTVPSPEQYKKLDLNDWDNWDYVPRDVDDKMMHFDKFIEKHKDDPMTHPANRPDYLMKLDSVGGAILFLKSVIYKQGVVFPPNYIIGTTWGRLEGYDGIETEGLCYIAKSLGYGCFGMPNMVAEHSAE
ncbi:uncharacterized protein AC631_02857 [Debaryomyces fabryi]|uniref:Uncharacterized protein n=1 Tax=Debaryomyces fabryi TaxID=58627 RepID=A0A0V1PYY8_9ASCO|nr:uncharacterized protein AC631_02857 [Debaryomyces fabryi]KSA01362.1 hypothetical protein AC631_02857 [Debaryomyces fabryi]CUM55681.1 unnamed protein product [Debaryomyces fabryi]